MKRNVVNQDQGEPAQAAAIRLSELVMALSVATDLGMGQPLEFALRSCVLAMRFGESLGYSDEALREIYFQSLLRYIGCNVDTQLLSSVVGDEFSLRADFATIDNGNNGKVLQVMMAHMISVNRERNAIQLAQAVAQGLIKLPEVKASFAGHCEVAQRLAERLGFEPNVVYALGQLYERWDGKGSPNGLKGEAIAPAVLIVTLAQDALLFHRLEGIDSAVNVLRERRGTAYAPHLVDHFCQHAESLFADLENEISWETVLALEPGKRVWLSGAEFNQACQVLADFVDIKSSYTLGHSTRVSQLASAAAHHYGLGQAEETTITRAALLHDLGKTGISSLILEKPTALTNREWTSVKLHPYHTECILAGSSSLSTLGTLASYHHERLDGSGYYRGLTGSTLSPSANILIAANAYCSLIEDRPYRASLSTDQAADVLMKQVHDGALESSSVSAVLAAAGHAPSYARSQTVAGLSEREVEVLRLLAQGHTTKQIAALLTISPKTADHHIQHIYDKISVSTRAGATLFVMEHQLLPSARSHNGLQAP